MDSQKLALLLNQAFLPRSLARRKIEMYTADLKNLDSSNVRLRVLMAGTVGEAALAKKILDMERHLIASEGKRQGGNLELGTDISALRSVVHKAVQECDISSIVSVLSSSGAHSLYNLYNRRLQMICIDALQELCHKNPTNRSRLVNCGGIAAILASTRIHASCQTFLCKATTLIISLPFFKDANAFVDRRGAVQPHKEHYGALIKRRKIIDDDSMDLGIASLLINTYQADPSCHIFNLIADSVDLDLFHVRLIQPGDECGNYERLLAVKQIPLVCRGLGSLVNDPTCLRRRLVFLRTCLASYLGDTSITTDTLGAIVL